MNKNITYFQPKKYFFFENQPIFAVTKKTANNSKSFEE